MVVTWVFERCMGVGWVTVLVRMFSSPSLPFPCVLESTSFDCMAGRPYDLTLATLTVTRLLHGHQLVASSPRVS